MSQLVFDEDAARRIEDLYRIGDAVRRRRIVRGALGAASGERVLDVGCGPGFYCAELLEEVGHPGR
jgi:arsenite methyltransferase